MRDDSNAARIEPETSPADIAVPPELGAEIAAFYGVDDVATAADWLDALEEGLEPSGEPFGIDQLCTTDESDHVLATADGEQAYQCVFDPMIVPFATGEPGTVRSVCPTTGSGIEIEIDTDGVHARPETAVFSLGIATDAAETAGEPPFSPAETYGSFCPYGNAFRSKAAYESWAAEVDATTAAIPLEYGVSLVGEMAVRLTDADGSADAILDCDCAVTGRS